jgi:hypothetical protein
MLGAENLELACLIFCHLISPLTHKFFARGRAGNSLQHAMAHCLPGPAPVIAHSAVSNRFAVIPPDHCRHRIDRREGVEHPIHSGNQPRVPSLHRAHLCFAKWRHNVSSPESPRFIGGFRRSPPKLGGVSRRTGTGWFQVVAQILHFKVCGFSVSFPGAADLEKQDRATITFVSKNRGP